MGLLADFIKFFKNTFGEEEVCSEGEDPCHSGDKGGFPFNIQDTEKTIVREIMTPRTDMLCLDINTPLEDIEKILVEWKNSNILVYRERIEDILGMLSLKELARAFVKDKKITHDLLVGILTEPYVVPAKKKIIELLDDLLKKKKELALVVDEYGGIIGVVTEKDIFREIVKNVGFVPGNTRQLKKEEVVLVDASTYIEKIEEIFGLDIPHTGFDTVGGLLFNLSGRIPIVGECFSHKNLLFEVEKAEKHKLQQISIRRLKND